MLHLSSSSTARNNLRRLCDEPTCKTKTHFDLCLQEKSIAQNKKTALITSLALTAITLLVATLFNGKIGAAFGLLTLLSLKNLYTSSIEYQKLQADISSEQKVEQKIFGKIVAKLNEIATKYESLLVQEFNDAEFSREENLTLEDVRHRLDALRNQFKENKKAITESQSLILYLDAQKLAAKYLKHDQKLRVDTISKACFRLVDGAKGSSQPYVPCEQSGGQWKARCYKKQEL